MKEAAAVGEITKRVTAENLLNWNVLKKVENSIIATNSFALLTSDFLNFQKYNAFFSKVRNEIFLSIRKRMVGRYMNK